MWRQTSDIGSLDQRPGGIAMPFTRHPDADRRISSVLAIVRALLTLDLYPRHKKRFLSNCLWQLTEAEGCDKYSLRFMSEAALSAARRELRHEHVCRRAKMVDKLIADPESAELILSKAIGCIVTRSEHARLAEVDRQDKFIDGWERYLRAGITVMDTMTETRLDFSRMTSD